MLYFLITGKHKRNYHLDCQDCKEVFTDIKEFYHHIKLCLTNAKQVKCPLCYKCYTSPKVLKYHLLLNECIIQTGGDLSIDVPKHSIF